MAHRGRGSAIDVLDGADADRDSTVHRGRVRNPPTIGISCHTALQGRPPAYCNVCSPSLVRARLIEVSSSLSACLPRPSERLTTDHHFVLRPERPVCVIASELMGSVSGVANSRPEGPLCQRPTLSCGGCKQAEGSETGGVRGIQQRLGGARIWRCAHSSTATGCQPGTYPSLTSS